MASTGAIRAGGYPVRVNLRRWLLSGYDPETGRLYLSIPHYTRRGALRTLYWQDRLTSDYAIDFRIEKASWLR